MKSFPKEGDLESAVYLSFVRRMSCFFCEAPPHSEAHHFPFRSRGYTDDSRTVPVCRSCHQRAHGITVKDPNRDMRHFPISEAEQERAADIVFRAFIETAADFEIKQYLRDASRRRESRVFVVPL